MFEVIEGNLAQIAEITDIRPANARYRFHFLFFDAPMRILHVATRGPQLESMMRNGVAPISKLRGARVRNDTNEWRGN
jgi:hypothetical protein